MEESTDSRGIGTFACLFLLNRQAIRLKQARKRTRFPIRPATIPITGQPPRTPGVSNRTELRKLTDSYLVEVVESSRVRL